MKPFAAGGRASIRTYAFLMAMVLIVAIFAYTYSLVRSFEKQTEILTTVFAKFCAAATYPATKNEEVRRVFNQVIKDINFPIVITDPRGVPYTWKNIGATLNPDDVTWETFVSSSASDPPPGTISEVLEIVAQMDGQHRPVMMFDPASGRFMGRVHYGLPAITRALKWLPLASGLLLTVFVVVGYVGVRGIIVGERRSIWIGMAKETAHQLGTPLSSLSGWLELMASELKGASDRNLQERLDHIGEMAGEMHKDMYRLTQIASRFSQIGSVPELKQADVRQVLTETITYFKSRTPQFGRHSIEVEYQEVPSVPLNDELMSWAFENLFKNAMDAIGNKPGRIRIQVRFAPEVSAVQIIFRDDGRGIEPAHVDRVFEPGFSTKKRGWGLGLTFVKRIVEEYHKGTIHILQTTPGEGTAFEILLPVAQIT